MARYHVGDEARKGMNLFGITDDDLRRALRSEIKQSTVDTSGWAHTVAVLERPNGRIMMHAAGPAEKGEDLDLTVLSFVPLPDRIDVQEPVAITLRALCEGGYGVYLVLGDDASGYFITDVVLPDLPIPDEWQGEKSPTVPPLGCFLMEARPDGKVHLVMAYLLDLEAIQRDTVGVGGDP